MNPSLTTMFRSSPVAPGSVSTLAGCVMGRRTAVMGVMRGAVTPSTVILVTSCVLGELSVWPPIMSVMEIKVQPNFIENFQKIKVS